MDFAAQASVLIAAADLQAVRSVTDAMRAADIASGRTGPNGTFPQMGPRQREHPEPRIEPREVIHPAPRIEPRFTIHPRPNIDPQPPAAPLEPELPVRTKSPLPPPWKQVVWKMPLQPAPKIKVVIHRTDVISKGSLIDFFI